MKLSIMVICYNQVKYIVQAIDSILSQKVNFNYEIIIGDDGSDDGSYELVKERYSGYDNISFFQIARKADSEKNGSIRASRLRIKLLEHVRGEYFAYLDGDDFYCDNMKFQRQVDVLDDSHNRNCVCCASNSYFYYHENDKKEITPRCIKSGKIPTKDYWRFWWFHASNCVFRSSIIEKLPHKVLDKVFHDNIITFWALQYGDLFYLNDVTMCYRQVKESNIWTGSGELVRHIRQVISADICDQMNRKMWFWTYYRNRISFEYLYNHRGNNMDIEIYVKLARELNCRRTLNLLCFEQQNQIKQFFIRVEHILLCKICYLEAVRMDSRD